MPVFQDSTSTQHERIFAIRNFGRCDPRMKPDLSPIIVRRRMIKLNPFAGCDVRIEAFCESKMRFFPLSIGFDNRPAQTTSFDVFAVWRKIFVFESRELTVLFEQMFVHIDVVIVLPVPDRNRFVVFVFDFKQELTVTILHASATAFEQLVSNRNGLPAVVASFTRRINHFKPLLCAAL